MIPHEPPTFWADAFNCPHCNAYADQGWHSTIVPNLFESVCRRCGEYALWHFKKMIYPEDAGVQPPNPDLHENIRRGYLEAKSIANKSPRGAAALLRLCIQNLCVQLGEKGKKIDDDIANLVKKGLPVEIQQSLDIVRVIGNNAVHPGVMDMTDDSDTALKLFELVNLIAYDRITQPKKVKELYESLPESKRKAIERRDKGKVTSSNSGQKRLTI